MRLEERPSYRVGPSTKKALLLSTALLALLLHAVAYWIWTLVIFPPIVYNASWGSATGNVPQKHNAVEIFTRSYPSSCERAWSGIRVSIFLARTTFKVWGICTLSDNQIFKYFVQQRCHQLALRWEKLKVLQKIPSISVWNLDLLRAYLRELWEVLKTICISYIHYTVTSSVWNSGIL